MKSTKNKLDMNKNFKTKVFFICISVITSEISQKIDVSIGLTIKYSFKIYKTISSCAMLQYRKPKFKLT